MRRARPAFTLVEALVAIAFAAMAGSALLLSTTSAVQTTVTSQEQIVGLAVAQQLMDEILGNAYVNNAGSAYGSPIVPDRGVVSGVSRQNFNNIGDFNGYTCQPPTDPWGIALGQDDGAGGKRNPNFQAPVGLMTNWQQQVSVYYVSATNLTAALPGGQTSDYRAVEVRVNCVYPNGSTRQLAMVRRVIAYVPPLQ